VAQLATPLQRFRGRGGDCGAGTLARGIWEEKPSTTRAPAWRNRHNYPHLPI